MGQRYDMEQDADGTWMVIDLTTNVTAIVNGTTLFGLDIEEADDMVDLLNNLELERVASTSQ